MQSEEKRISSDIQKRIQYHLYHTWGDSIDSTQKDRFMSNFSDENKIVGYVLLDMLLFHNQSQEKQLIKSLLRKLYSSIYKEAEVSLDIDSGDIHSFLEKEMKMACFIPVLDKNPADSSNAWTSIIREQVGGSDSFYEAERIPLLVAIRKKFFVFYDDMLGTGNQFETFLTKKRYDVNEKKAYSILDIVEANDIKVYYLCIAGCSKGIGNIEEKYPRIKVIVSERFEECDSVLSKDNEYWAYYSKDFRNYIIGKIEHILEDEEIEEPFSKNIAVMFERNRPSNTVFPLYWYNKKQWKPLKSREER